MGRRWKQKGGDNVRIGMGGWGSKGGVRGGWGESRGRGVGGDEIGGGFDVK